MPLRPKKRPSHGIGFTILSALLVVWLGWSTYIHIQHNRAVRAFYGEGNYRSEIWLIAPPSATIGNQANVVHFLAAKSTDDGRLSCDHVTNVAPEHGTVSVVGDDTPVCCWAGPEQYMAPVKQVEGRTHFLCGTYPHLHEVSVAAPASLLGIGR
jgi:hypothetical protein